MAAMEARAAALGLPEPSSLLTRVFAAIPKHNGGMKQNDTVLLIKLTDAKLTSGDGKSPADSTMISDAHHSDIITELGKASFKKGPQF